MNHTDVGVHSDASWEDHIFFFDHPHPDESGDLSGLLGGKGAGLAEMTRSLQLPVPPGFTIALDACRSYRESGWPDGLDDAIRSAMAELERRMGRRFGDAQDPLLVSVRSGAPVSMPGMLDTVLNLGLNAETVKGLARSSDEHFAWDTYRRFLEMYAAIVMDVPTGSFPGFDDGSDAAASTPEGVRALEEHIVAVAGRPVPEDPFDQLRDAIEAVFRSWDSERARAYRLTEKLDEDMGTAVNIQSMVFGNRGQRSGTGVVFTRDPSTGERRLYGDYLPNAQGEDVVAGRAQTRPIDALAEHCPEAHHDLVVVLERLERHYRDVCDVEFTIEEGHLYLLQTRVAKRGAVAAVRCAVSMVNDPTIALTPQEAVDRVPAEVRARARQEVIDAADLVDPEHEEIGVGLGASPGRVSGQVALSSEAVGDVEDDVILVRPETSPSDVPGMAAATGVLTTRGGLVSHAAVVARGWGIPAVVGASTLDVTAEGIRTPSGELIRAGEIITIDGATGRVWRGDFASRNSGELAAATQLLETELPELALLEQWARGPEQDQPQTQGKDGATMRIEVDRVKCTALGVCESLAPERFEVNEEGTLDLLQPDVPSDEVERMQEIVKACPTGALSLVDR
jgi:pyruvate,orthophosphate dikinase